MVSTIDSPQGPNRLVMPARTDAARTEIANASLST
jgi:hypothetical protein